MSTFILPITSRISGSNAYPLRVPLPPKICSLEKPSELLISQILAWDHRLFLKELGDIPELVQQRVRAALRSF